VELVPLIEILTLEFFFKGRGFDPRGRRPKYFFYTHSFQAIYLGGTHRIEDRVFPSDSPAPPVISTVEAGYRRIPSKGVPVITERNPGLATSILAGCHTVYTGNSGFNRTIRGHCHLHYNQLRL